MNQARALYRNQDLPHEQGLIAYSEKFAELIVKECLDKVVEYEIVKHGSPSYPLYDRIFKHFGVEE
jgi:hypothetical protein